MEGDLSIKEVLFLIHLVGSKHEIYKLEGDEEQSDFCRDVAMKLLGVIDKIEKNEAVMRGPNQMGV